MAGAPIRRKKGMNPIALSLLPKRDLCSDAHHPMRVKLVRKLADVLNGVDLSKISVGDMVDLIPYQAQMLILEGWAEEAPRQPGRVINLQSVRNSIADSEE